jgi:hypothetical protein
MIDLKRYHRLQPQGLCWVEKCKDNNDYVVLFKRFDNENGKELTPEPNYVTIENLEKDKKELTIQLEALLSILEDIKKL